MHEQADTLARVEHIPLDALPFSSLYRDYCTRFDRVADFYGRDWRAPGDRLAAVAEAASHPRDRQGLVSVLREQQKLWGVDTKADRQLERLLDPRSAAVVTGQQVGLFTGPLYTVLKALTTIRLARQLEDETGHPVVPVFWLGSEDHDFDEMAGVGLPSGDGVEDLRYAGHELPNVGNLGPVGALAFTDDITRLVDRAAELLPTTDFHAALIDRLRAAYAPGVTFRDAFGRLFRTLLPESGLVLMSADDVRLKRIALPLWKREVTDGSALHEALAETSALVDARYHSQVRTSPTNLFVLHEGSRLPIDLDGTRYVIRGTGISMSAAELLEHLDTETDRFTPNVVLRPLTQDWLLPTAAYVGGPGEVAYFAQFKPSYGWAGLPMPVIQPRVTVSLIEPRIRRVLDRLELPIPAFDGDIEALFSRVVVEKLGFDLDARFDDVRATIDGAMSELVQPIATVDPSLEKTVEATRAAVGKELDRLRERVVRSERRRQDELRSQLVRVAGALFPGQHPQERVISPLYFAAKFGPEFLPGLLDRLDPFEASHHVLDC